jgi:3D (Asp-Asp-Asp) domain-containing protein
MRLKEKLIAALLAGFAAMGQANAQVDTPVGDKGSANVEATASESSIPVYKVESTPIPFTVEYEFSRTVGPGRLLTVRKGVPGKVVKTYKVEVKNGKAVGKTLVSTKKTPAVSQLVYMGRTGYAQSRHKFTRSKVMVMEATAYDPSAGRGRNATFRTATGMRAQFGLVAVDPRVIPLGTKLYIEGYGFALAADTGGAIKGNKIDLCYNSRAQCFKFGRRKVTVHILK